MTLYRLTNADLDALSDYSPDIIPCDHLFDYLELISISFSVGDVKKGSTDGIKWDESRVEHISKSVLRCKQCGEILTLERRDISLSANWDKVIYF